MGDEVNSARDLAAAKRLGDVVEGGSEAQSLDPMSFDASTQCLFLKLTFHSLHDLKGVLERVEVMV